MILYNVTVSIDQSAHLEWLDWMKTVHIPDVMKTGMFLESKLLRIHAFEEGGLSYSVQYLAASAALYKQYELEFAPALQAEHAKKYAGKFAAFRTMMEVLDHQTTEA